MNQRQFTGKGNTGQKQLPSELESIFQQAERALDLSELSREIFESQNSAMITQPQSLLGILGESNEALLKPQLEVTPSGGPPLLESLVQISRQERSLMYKSNTLKRYRTALRGTAALYERLVKGEQFDYQEVEARVVTFMDVLERDRALLLNLASIREFQDDRDYLSSHALNVCLLTLALAAGSRFPRENIIEIGVAGLLMDLGMACIDPTIRLKNQKLDESDREEIAKHPALGLQLLQNINGLPQSVLVSSYQHHERESGTGYPHMRKGNLIHPYSKLLSIADVYEAMGSPRQYRQPLLPYRVMETLINQTSQGHYQSGAMRIFLRHMSLFPVGSLVRLSDGALGKVVASNGDLYDKPFISLLMSPDGKFFPENKGPILDLSKILKLKILEPVPFAEEKWALLDGF